MLDIEGMPDRPREKPLDWGWMAEQFDRFVMNPANGVLFTDSKGNLVFTAFLEDQDSRGMQHELFAFGPIVLGKILRGDDVTALLPSLAAYFNEEAGIFVNRPGQNRIELWYLMQANALAAHIIRRQLMNDLAFVERWRRSANRLREVAQRLGYDFDHQGYDFSTEGPWTEKELYKQPDVIGAYAYLMLLAYETFREEEYLGEARVALEKYLAFPQNPWYEITSGAMAAIAAARLRSMGFETNLQRALEFTLDPHANLIIGQWGGREVNGLCRGWRFSKPESAYSMESLVILPYILPIPRYDTRYARVIGKYALNVAANARLFYSGYTGEESRADLSPVVAYERLFHSYKGRSPYAAGDFYGHKSIYGGAYALWWGAIVKPTNDDFILQLDLTKTDFLEKAAYPAFLYYNPWPKERVVRLEVDQGLCDLYNLSTHEAIHEHVNDVAEIVLPPKGTRVVTVMPSSGA